MPEMARIEQSLCRSAPWRWLAREIALPWALQGHGLRGDVLEIGGGSGAMAAEILVRFPEVRLTVTDYDDSMVEAARERLRPFGDRVTVRSADATTLSFADESFDTVVSFIMLHHVLDWEAAVTEAIRVLRPEGRLVGYDLLANAPVHWFHELERSAHRLMKLDELRQELGTLPVRGSADRALAGLTVRFNLKKEACA